MGKKQFADGGSLTRHMLTHVVERPHKCDVCQKQFARRSSLESHMLLHH